MNNIRKKNVNQQKLKKQQQKQKKIKQQLIKKNKTKNKTINNNNNFWIKVREFYSRECLNNNDFVNKYLKNYNDIKNINLVKIRKKNIINNDLKENENIYDLTEKYINNNLITTRLGCVECRFICSYKFGLNINDNFDIIDEGFENCDYYMKKNAGLYYKNINDKKEVLDWWVDNTIEIVNKSIITSCLSVLNFDLLLWSKLNLKGIYYNWGNLHKVILKNSENKKILYIGSAVESIKTGYERGVQNAWNFDIPIFTMYYLQTPQTTSNMEYPDNSIKESVEKILDEILEKYNDFDTAILGCGAYGPPIINLLNKKYNNSKNLIYLGSSCYTMFGIYSEGMPIPEGDCDIKKENWLRVVEKLDSRCKDIDKGKYWS